MDNTEYRETQLASDYVNRRKFVSARPPQPEGVQVDEQRILTMLGLTYEQLRAKIETHNSRSGENRSTNEEKSRVVRTIIGVLHSAGGGMVRGTKDKYLMPEFLIDNKELFVTKYCSDYRQFYRGDEPII